MATFYNQFRFQAPGRHHIQVCRGTACHVKGSAAVLEALCRHLKIQPGQTTRDGLFSLEVVACIGACGLAPVIAVDGEFHAGVTPDAVAGIVDVRTASRRPSMPEGAFPRCCDRCWHSPELPCPEVVACRTEGPLCHDDAACAARPGAPRRDPQRRAAARVASAPAPAGSAPGAGRTLAAVRDWLGANDDRRRA